MKPPNKEKSEKAPRKTYDCRHWLRGDCTLGDDECRFAHDPDKKGSQKGTPSGRGGRGGRGARGGRGGRGARGGRASFHLAKLEAEAKVLELQIRKMELEKDQ